MYFIGYMYKGYICIQPILFWVAEGSCVAAPRDQIQILKLTLKYMRAQSFCFLAKMYLVKKQQKKSTTAMQKILSWFIYAAGGGVFLVGCYYNAAEEGARRSFQCAIVQILIF